MSEQRFPPIAAEDMTEAQRALVQTIASGPRGGVRGPFLALLHHPVLADRLQALGEHLRYGTGMPDTLVELAIIVTARHWGCQYEWVAHERLARKAGLNPAIIEAVAKGEVPAGMSEDEATVHAFCREALEEASPPPPATRPRWRASGGRACSICWRCAAITGCWRRC